MYEELLGDLVRYDSIGRVRRPDNTLMTVKERELIIENRERIINGLGELAIDYRAEAVVDQRLPMDIALDLGMAMKEYGMLAAKRERSTITPGLTKRRLQTAGQQLESALQLSRAYTKTVLSEAGLSTDTAGEMMRHSESQDAIFLNLDIQKNAERLAEPKGPFKAVQAKFLDWWARQDNGNSALDRKSRFLSKVKKGGVMAAVSAPVGIAAGIVAAPLAGAAVGAVVAAGTARGVARGLMKGRIDQAANAKTLAERHYAERVERHQAVIDEDLYDVVCLTKVVQQDVEANVRRNRRRMVLSAAIGFVAAVGGSVAAELADTAIHTTGWFDWHHGPSGTAQPQASPSPSTTPGSVGPHGVPGSGSPPAGSGAPEHGELGQGFRVEHGHGVTHEIIDYAHQHDYGQVTPEQAFHMYKQLFHTHGKHLINLENTPANTYARWGSSVDVHNLGISSPGRAHWFPGVEQDLRQLLEEEDAA